MEVDAIPLGVDFVQAITRSRARPGAPARSYLLSKTTSRSAQRSRQVESSGACLGTSTRVAASPDNRVIKPEADHAGPFQQELADASICYVAPWRRHDRLAGLGISWECLVRSEWGGMVEKITL